MTRLSQSKTENFSQSFVRAIMLPIAMKKPGLHTDDIAGYLNTLQPG